MVYVSQVGGAVPARILMCQSKIGSASKLNEEQHAVV